MRLHLEFLDQYRALSFPFFGSFFLFNIDPVECVRHLNDPELDDLASQMRPKQYLGFVDSILSFDRSTPYIVYRLIFISHGITEANEAEGITADMCLPILPTTYHPTNRKPLKPNKPLPFKNCYFQTLSPMAVVRVKTVWRKWNDATILTVKEKSREYSTSGQDMVTSGRAKKGYLMRQYEEWMKANVTNSTVVEAANAGAATESSGNPSPVQVEEPSEERNQPNAIESGVAEPSSGDPKLDDDRASNLSKTSERDDFLEHLAEGGLSQALFARGYPDESLIAITNITYDLTSAKDGTFAEPAEFFEEEKYLKGLIEQAKLRAVKRARQVDQEKYGQTSQGIVEERVEVLGQSPASPGLRGPVKSSTTSVEDMKDENPTGSPPSASGLHSDEANQPELRTKFGSFVISLKRLKEWSAFKLSSCRKWVET